MGRHCRGVLWLLFSGLLLWAQMSWGQSSSNTLRYVENVMPLGRDPITGTGTAVGVRLVDLIFDGMTGYDTRGRAARSLADTLIFSGSTVKVQLKPGVTWHDGQPILPKDVLYSYNTYVHRESRYTNKGVFDIFEEIQADDREIRIRFVPGLSDTVMMAMLDFDLLPPRWVDYATVRSGSQFSKRPVGAGPYMLAEAKDNEVSLRAHRPYHDGGPLIDSVQMQIQPMDASHPFMVSAGIIELDPVVRPQDIPLITADRNTKLVPYDSQTWSGIAFNYGHPFLRFENVRKALTIAFDRKKALSAYLAGMGEVISGPFARSSFAYDSTIAPWEYDQPQARKLLADMGFVDSNRDQILDREGEDFRLNMVLRGQMSDANRNICTDFQRQLSTIGVQVDISDISNDSSYVDIVYHRHEFDLTFVTWKFDAASNIYPLFSDTETDPGELNFIEFRDVHVQAALQDFNGALSIDEKIEAGKRLHRLLHEKSPYLFLWSLHHGAQHTRQLEDPPVHPFYFFTFVHTWHFKGMKGTAY